MDIKKMFNEAAVRAVKEKKGIGENSLLNRQISKADDHYTVCPFRSIDIDECPLCKLEELGKI